jgi:SAM-dependent methyltransferase
MIMESEFDKFAEDYRQIHAANIWASGETPEFFAEYKIQEVARRSRLDAFQPRTILDFGSGVGNSIPYFRKYFPGALLTCADVSEESLRVSRQRYTGSEDYAQIIENKLPFSTESFDLVFSACVFHHIEHDVHEHWLKELHRVSKIGARLFIFEHNPLNPVTRSAVNACPLDEHAELINARSFYKRIMNSHWQSAQIRYQLFFPKALKTLRRLEPYMEHFPLGAQYYVSASKTADIKV